MKRHQWICALLVALWPLANVVAEEADTSEEPKEPEWSVDGEFGGEISTVNFTTDEGTWMNLDVSPDGETIVFDLLGDIYTVPMAGGQATQLTSGAAYDIQPRFSPDGSQISFTSDRAGGDNIWVMAADGSDAKQITEEDFRLLNNADWSPDGNYIVARKHFTSQRSLGAGEVWLYHTGGGKGGIQLTKKKNDQQDAGQPVYSPDGKYIYLSEDMSGGSTFQYNKDANGQIYVIRRLHTENGQIDEWITGNGGAVAPAPSPDGRYIAFVRRARDKSVLNIFDNESGRQIPLFDGLSHDQQEAWAIFGPYPNMSWTPDSEQIVFWAQGGIHKIDIASREVTQIPFSADVEQTVVSAVRADLPIEDGPFTVRMIRDAVTSPDGEWLVFHGAGYLWKKQLPDGEPVRLTRGDAFEYEPAFSPDGRKLVYVSWSDDELGGLHVIGLNGRGHKELSEHPGHYREPRFSPNGEMVTFRKEQGSFLQGYDYGLNPGLYWMDAKGGEEHLIIGSGAEPAFTADNQGIYYLSGGGLEKTYKRIKLDGSDDHEVFKLKYIDRIVPSADGRWIAFNELYQAYVAPLPPAGSVIDLNKDTKALPLRKVTVDVGAELHWSNDTLHWLVGEAYFSQPLSDMFEFVDGAPEELPEPDALTGISIGLQLETDVPEQTLALTGARIISMNGDEVIDGGTIVIENNRIVAIGAEVDVPAGAEVVDVSGKTIVPGFIDAHAHAGHFHGGPSPQSNWAYYANLAYGVTTAHDPSAFSEFVFSQGEMVKAGTLVGPRIFSTGTILYGADGDFKAVVNSLDDARSHLNRMKAIGAHSVKSYNQPRRNQRQWINQAARELGMIVVMEGGSTFYHNMTMVLDGSTGIEHNIPIAPLYKDVVEVWSNTDVRYTPTLVVSYGGMSGEYYWYQHTEVADAVPLVNFVPQWTLDARARRRQMTPDEEYNHIQVAEAVEVLREAGVKVQSGGHGQMQGLAMHWEMWSIAQGGMSPHNVLRTATIDSADYLGLAGDIGSLEVGKLADLVVLDANPLEDIRNTEKTAMVMINGRLYDTHSMDQLQPEAQERPMLWFEREGAARSATRLGGQVETMDAHLD